MRKGIYFIALAVCSTTWQGATAQLMRLAVLPQATIKVPPQGQAMLQTMSIDYYQTEPNATLVPTQPVYNQVYSGADVRVKINNKISHKSFQNLVEGDNALLLLRPLSKEHVQAEINPLNPDAQGVESIELDVLAPVEIGYNNGDANVKQAQLIFKNFGTQLPAATYFSKAMCLDIMQQNKLLTVDENNILSPASARLLAKLAGTIDAALFAPRDYKTIINSGFVRINDSGTLTAGSTAMLQQVFYYQLGITATQAINNGWKTKSYTDCKTAFYNESYNLTTPPCTDAAQCREVNGVRYTRMAAWKAPNFAIPGPTTYTYKRNDSVFYKSAGTFFAGAFFMTRAADLEQWIRQHRERTGADSRLCLMQLLGLPPNSGNDLVAEMWVKETDMFRPGIDSTLELRGVLTTVDSGYMKSLLGYSTGSFSSASLFGKYPFTGLGYTWDWYPENKQHVGLNEFVLKEGREVYISNSYSTEAFIKQVQQR